MGKNTEDLIKYTQRYVNYSTKIYGQVWVVFDKDDYDDEQFDRAIRNCGYNSCWSNPNFELQLLSHFKCINKYISKDNIFKELDKEFQKYNLGNYTKNEPNLFEKITTNNRISEAIKNCEYMENLNKDNPPSKRNPMTKVYKILKDLEDYL